MNLNSTELNRRVAKAVASYWSTRRRQSAKQGASGQRDRGARSAVTGGAQMDGFIKLLTELIEESGIQSRHIFHNTALELPGFFRPTKTWDLVVVKNGKLVAALMARSSLADNADDAFDQIVDESLASALDFWTAFREGAFALSGKPWLGFALHVAGAASRDRTGLEQPHFPVRPEFKACTIGKRVECFCRKLVRERWYDATLLVTSENGHGQQRAFCSPDEDLGIEVFWRSLTATTAAYAD